MSLRVRVRLTKQVTKRSFSSTYELIMRTVAVVLFAAVAFRVFTLRFSPQTLDAEALVSLIIVTASSVTMLIVVMHIKTSRRLDELAHDLAVLKRELGPGGSTSEHGTMPRE